MGYTYNTYSGYENIVRNHLKPAFGQYRLYALANSPDVVQQFIDSMKLKGFSRNMISNNSPACLEHSTMQYSPYGTYSRILACMCRLDECQKIPNQRSIKNMSFRRKSSSGSLTGSRKALLPICPLWSDITSAHVSPRLALLICSTIWIWKIMRSTSPSNSPRKIMPSSSVL